MKLMGGLSRLAREEVVDVLFADLREERLTTRRLRGFHQAIEDLFQLFGGLLHAETHEPERGAAVEDDDQDDPLPDDRDVQVVALPLVEEDRELLLSDELREAARRGDVSGGEGSEAGRVEVLD